MSLAVLASTLSWSQAAKADPLTGLLDLLFRGPPALPTPPRRPSAPSRVSQRPIGSTMIASFYGDGEPLNVHTANGEVFHPHGFTAAHRSLPFGTRLTVCFRGCTTVRVNDRGPAAWTGRSLDLSHGAARAIGMTNVGVARVRVANGG